MRDNITINLSLTNIAIWLTIYVGSYYTSPIWISPIINILNNLYQLKFLSEIMFYFIMAAMYSVFSLTYLPLMIAKYFFTVMPYAHPIMFILLMIGILPILNLIIMAMWGKKIPITIPLKVEQKGDELHIDF